MSRGDRKALHRIAVLAHRIVGLSFFLPRVYVKHIPRIGWNVLVVNTLHPTVDNPTGSISCADQTLRWALREMEHKLKILLTERVQAMLPSSGNPWD